MGSHRSRFAPTIAVLALLSSCAQEQAAEAVATFEWETMGDPDPTILHGENRYYQIVEIAENGKLRLDANEIPNAERQLALTKLESDGIYQLWIRPETDTRFIDVVSQMSFIEQKFRPEMPPSAKLDFKGFEQYRQLLTGSSGVLFGIVANKEFDGPIADTELGVLVRHSKADGTCRAYLGSEIVSSDLLREKGFHAIDTLVQENGGIEAVLNDPDWFDGVIARLRADKDTPWRCVAAAFFGISASGWPKVRFEVMES
jgi:hypothetical protein